MPVRRVLVYLKGEVDSFSNVVKTPTVLSISLKSPKEDTNFLTEDVTDYKRDGLEGRVRDGSSVVLVKD